MDIYNFMNSKDVAEHCRKINHQFNSIEAAFIVYLNRSTTISEKHKAWNEIITTMPDMEIPKRPNIAHYDSLHEFLKMYMELENKLLDRFVADDLDAAYNYDKYYIDDNGESCEDSRLFPTLTDVFVSIQKDNTDNDIYKCRIQKRWLGEEEKYIEADIAPNREAISIYGYSILTEAEVDILVSFDGLWIEIPTPFQQGDILTCNPYVRWHGFGEIFVLDEICYWDKSERMKKRLCECADSSDMTAYGYWLNEDGSIFYECMHTYPDLEYYRDELQGKDRTLKAVSSFLKDEISLTLLLQAYDIILDEERVKGNRKHLGYMEEALKSAGLYLGEENLS